MSRIIVVGGNGYIGQRLVPMLLRRGRFVWAIDPCVLAPPAPVFGEGGAVLIERRIEDCLNEINVGDTVVYLASFHDYPGEKSDRLWRKAFDLMVGIPMDLAKRGVRHLIYLSSMRVFRSGFYAGLKQEAEGSLSGRPNVSIVRPGTVFGRLEYDLYNRTLTVPNRYILTGELPDENWSAYCSHMDAVLRCIERLLYSTPGQVLQPLVATEPVTRKNLCAITGGYVPYMGEAIKLETVHPFLKLCDFYKEDPCALDSASSSAA